MCPELIRKGYGMLKGFMAQQIAVGNICFSLWFMIFFNLMSVN